MAEPVIGVTVSDAQVKALESVLDPKQVRQALFQAVKRTVGGPRSGALGNIRSRIGGELTISNKYLKRLIYAKVPRGDVPEGSVTIKHDLVPLIAFKPRVTKRGGARVTLSKSKGEITIPGAFKAKVGTGGHLGVFMRTRHMSTKGENADEEREWVYKGKKHKSRIKMGPKGYANAFAIKEAFGPSPLNVFGEEGTTKIAQEELSKIHGLLQKNLDSQISRFLNGKPAAAADGIA